MTPKTPETSIHAVPKTPPMLTQVMSSERRYDDTSSSLMSSSGSLAMNG